MVSAVVTPASLDVPVAGAVLRDGRIVWLGHQRPEMVKFRIVEEKRGRPSSSFPQLRKVRTAIPKRTHAQTRSRKAVSL